MTEPPPFRLDRGGAPLIVSVPHISTYIPPDLARRLSSPGLRGEDTDWHVDRLYGFLDRFDATIIKATHSRYLVDLNRPPDGGKLYPGKAETSLCPTETFAGEPLYLPGGEPDIAEIDRRRREYWQPYHDALETEIGRLRALHPRILLLDAHSISSLVPRLFEGRLPDLNFGTAGGRSAATGLVERLAAAAEGSSFSKIINGRFKGGFITRHYGRPAEGVDAVQLELGWSCYLDPAHPQTYDSVRAAPLVSVLERIISAAVEDRAPNARGP